tara:strand:+ start:152 stop:526 length:375 start_codon:yes stop_codon:yes gene_type:complete
LLQKSFFSKLIFIQIEEQLNKIMKHFKFFIFIIFITLSQNLDADETLNLGKNIFLEKGNCATCHALSDAGSNADIGPNLNQIKPDIGRVILAVTNGIGVMPAYEGILTTEEIEAVAKYVSEKSN